MNFLGFIIIARSLGPKDLGTFTISLSFVSLFMFFSDLGFNASHVKRISEEGNVSDAFSTFLAIKISIIAIFILFCAGGLLLQNKFSFYHVDNAREFILISSIFLGYLVLQRLGEVSQLTFQALRETGRQQGPLVAGSIVRFTIILACYLTAAKLAVYVSSYVIGSLVTLLISARQVSRYFKWKFDIKILKKYISFAIPVSIYTIFVSINSNYDKLLLGHKFGGKSAAILYSGQQIILVIVTIVSAFESVLFPTFSSLYKKESHQEINSVLNSAERYISLLIVPLILFLLFNARDVVFFLLGKQYDQTIFLFQVLLCGTLLTTLNSPFEQLLIGTRYIYSNIRFGLVNLLLNIIFCSLLIPDELFGIRLFGLGPAGAVLASVLSYIPRFVMARYFVYSRFVTKLSMSNIYIFAWAVGILILEYLAFSVVKSSFLILIVKVIVFYVTFASSLFLTGLFTAFELKNFLSVIRWRS